MTKEMVYDVVRSALDRLCSSDDMWLLEDDVNERSISFRLAVHLKDEIESLEGVWEGLHVDCEYNRDVTNPTHPYTKKLNLPKRNDVSNEDTHATTVFPDIIVHRRRSRTNIIVIEIKKNGGPSSAEEFDRNHKIPAYLYELGYSFGVFLVLGIEGEAGSISECSIYELTGDGVARKQFP